MKKDKISLIIPMYNVENYIDECLNSVINQDYGIQNIEVILIDDCSNDKTVQIVENYVQKYNFILIKNKSNSGQAVSRNKGIAIATGKYIAFLDSDDILYKNNLSQLYNQMVENDADLVFARLNSFNSKGEYGYYSDKYINEYKVTNVYESPNLLNCISICSKLYKASLIKNIKFLEHTFHEDNSFTLETLFNAKKIAIYPKYLYYRRIREDENNKSTMQKLDYKTFNDLILNYSDVLNNIQTQNNILFLYKYMIKKLNNYIINHVKKEDKSKAKKSILSFINEFHLSNRQKRWFQFYNKIYYLFANLYGMVRK